MLSLNRVLIRTAAALAALIGAGLALAQAPPPPLNPIAAEGNAERGEVLAETCRGCHGVPGAFNAYPAFRVPKLGGQNADYIEVALQGYRRGTRAHPTMQAQASSLSDQDIADVAAYFAGLPGEAETGRSSGSTMQVAEGQEKAMLCQQCHGAEGVAAAPQWPNLAGQHESYLLHAMMQYKSGARVDMLMAPLVAQLDEPTLEAIAAFFAAQPHLHNTPR